MNDINYDEFIEHNPYVYECPICYEEYDDELDAEECLSRCLRSNYVSEKDNKEPFKCVICNKKSKYFSITYNCIKKHIDNNDKLYVEYIQEINKQKMFEAANFPGQLKLNTY